MSPPRILSIAGSDSSGGAGIQADIKTITVLGGYAMTAITALTAQNTLGVQAVRHIDGDFILQQIASCVEDIGCDAIKIGMLGTEEMVRHVAAALVLLPEVGARSAAGFAKGSKPPGLERFPIVLDPVMVATSGSLLTSSDTIEAMKSRLFPIATLLTPNLPELGVLTGTEPRTLAEMQAAAASLAGQYSVAVLAKGGHLEGDRLVDLLVQPDGHSLAFEGTRIDTPHTHGTGCTLSSAIATHLGRGLPLAEAIDRARLYVRSALRAAPGFGSGHGPLGHAEARG
ncbi:hydroxymethylpyrimidine/phosphomethylpyrimidine kinase [Novosphingobium kunmingense]|uniref:hydroxymethylpyrimidine kinase n=1 Tax=Novosphingobium kunmingense TaxID=1211806 RepID=A0A2N0H738_9SPHN|nr:bifunctional hydroxymethylpyrimidine kinase/phosphomethylpyrimidine kinase [Novosphingobium kunmingense]PKB14765.1 hydroxymethylpyrimidine/phosphomethylpyrimidine kinase [Novosphingobium kunmingense]